MSLCVVLVEDVRGDIGSMVGVDMMRVDHGVFEKSGWL